MTQTVTLPDGTVHRFPDEATPEMIAEAIGVEPPPSKLEKAGDTAVDVALSAGQGTKEGLSSLVNFPADIYEIAKAAVGRGVLSLLDKAGVLPTGMYDALMQDYEAMNLPSAQTTMALNALTGGAHEPQTTAGKYARTGTQFISGTLPSTERKLITQALIPAAISETAGQLTNDNPWARLAGAVAPAAAAKVFRVPKNGEAILAKQIPNISQEDLIQSQILMDRARAMGIKLSAAEAVQQITNGKTGLSDVQRVLEHSSRSGPSLKEFYAERPAANTAAMESILKQVSPEQISPFEIAPKIQTAAKSVIDQTRQEINKQAQPFYDQSMRTPILAEDFAAVKDNPSFQKALAAVRADPELGAQIQGLPDNSVGVFDAVKKHLRTLSENAANPASANQDLNKARLRSMAEKEVVEAAKKADPRYAQALQIGAEGRQSVLAPLERAPLGQLASSETLGAQKSVLFKPNPPAGSEQGVFEAVSKLTGLTPTEVSELTRQYLAMSFNEANQALVSGLNQYGGAKFAATVAGNEQQARNLEAVIRALPDGEAKWLKVKSLLDVFKAQGRRMPAGSQTAANLLIQGELAQGSPVGEAASVGASPGRWLTTVGDTLSSWRYGRNAQAAADVLMDPKGAEMLAEILRRRQPGPTLEDFYRQAPYITTLETQR